VVTASGSGGGRLTFERLGDGARDPFFTATWETAAFLRRPA